ncbi:unnamed protein product [Amaranthus hypochondriacus]
MANENEYNNKQLEKKNEEYDDRKHDIPKGIWEEFSLEFHELLEKLICKFHGKEHVENLLQEKPKDSEDKTAISNWLDKLINLFKSSKEDDTNYLIESRGLDVSEQEVVGKLERFKVKNLGTGSTTVNKDNNKK